MRTIYQGMPGTLLIAATRESFCSSSEEIAGDGCNGCSRRKSATALYVDIEFTIVETMKRLNPAEFNVSALYQAGMMQEVAAYAYWHKKHAALVPIIAEILKAMMQEGLFESYRKIALEQP